MADGRRESELAGAGSDAAGPSSTPWDRVPRTARRACPALLVYGVATLLHLVILTAMIPPGGPSLRDRLLAWDGLRYTQIASNGYPHGLTDDPAGSNLAFFPLFPLLARAVHAVTGLDYGMAVIVTANLAFAAALVICDLLLTRLYGRRTALIAVVLLATAQPMAVVFGMGYSEALFLALAAGSLLAAHRNAWLTAGTLGLLAGLTRPAAVAVVAALAVAVVPYVVRSRPFAWRPVAAVALACCGMPLYLWWVGRRAGRPDAWFVLQRSGWNTYWDYGRSFIGFLGLTLTRGDGWVAVSAAVLLLGLLTATALTWRRDTWPPLLVYGVGILVTALGQSSYYHCKLRLVITAVLFVVPLARALSRASLGTNALVLSTGALFGCWYGAYMLTAWHYGI
ncbi:hypothetical protein [Streptomyces sp. NPDC046759]|uniref:hypothetical protein n=1 Tax=Streptomyces sp. NPDC046759 TaxID=3155019 RepID=UPI0033E150AE